MGLDELSPLVKQVSGDFHIHRQMQVVSVVIFGILACGFHLGFTTGLLEDLKHPESPIKIDTTSASWLVSCIAPSNLIGFFCSSCLMDPIGRPKTIILFSMPGILSWILIYLAKDITILILGRIFGGIFIGGLVVLGAVIIGEYSSPKYRGIFLSLKTTAICLGSMIVHILDNCYHWKTIACIGMTIQIFALVATFTLPESPHWLASKKRFEESRHVYYWLRDTTSQSKQEINEIIRLQQEKRPMQNSWQIARFLRKFGEMDFLKPAIIILFSFILLESSGRHFFPAYARQILKEITVYSSESSMYTLGMDTTITVSTLLSTFLIMYMGRRTVLFATGSAAIITIFIACTITFLASNGFIPLFSWLNLALFAIYFVLVNLGCTPIPMLLLGEIFPLQHRAAGSAATGVIASITLWITMRALPYMLETTKVYGTFGVFGLTQLFALLVLYFILPETKDRTLEEIEYYFKSGCFKSEEDEEAA